MVTRARHSVQVGTARGVVLVDVIIGTIILAIALSVMLSIASRAISAETRGTHLRTAAMLLDEQLALVLARGPDNYASRFPVDGACDDPFQSYQFELEFSGGQAGDPYLVRATVSWREGRALRSASVETMIAPRLGDDPDPDRRPEQAEGRPS